MAFCRTSRHLKHVHNVGGKCICTKTEKGEEKRPLITAIIIFQTDMSVAKGDLYLCDFHYSSPLQLCYPQLRYFHSFAILNWV